MPYYSKQSVWGEKVLLTIDPNGNRIALINESGIGKNTLNVVCVHGKKLGILEDFYSIALDYKPGKTNGLSKDDYFFYVYQLILNQDHESLSVQSTKNLIIAYVVSDVDAAYERAIESGLACGKPSNDFLGTRLFVIDDPYGNKLVLIDKDINITINSDNGELPGNAALDADSEKTLSSLEESIKEYESMTAEPDGPFSRSFISDVFSKNTRSAIDIGRLAVVTIADTVLGKSISLFEMDYKYPNDFRVSELRHRYHACTQHFMSMVDMLDKLYSDEEDENDDFK